LSGKYNDSGYKVNQISRKPAIELKEYFTGRNVFIENNRSTSFLNAVFDAQWIA
jgi:hypothetical protein